MLDVPGKTSTRAIKLWYYNSTILILDTTWGGKGKGLKGGELLAVMEIVFL
jgi:hypothetical protein